MPRCQRTFRRLSDSRPATGGGGVCWVCPHCPDHEIYTTVHEADLLDWACRAEREGSRDFAVAPDTARPTLLLRGLHPECVYEPADRRYEIYLQDGSDPWQLRLQIAHETFHRLCSRGRIFHWTHEMLACLFAVRLLGRHGYDDYAACVRRDYHAQAGLLSTSDLLATDLYRSYPPGLYGRAFVTGEALVAAAGWDAVCRLAAAPNIDSWRAGLSASVAGAVSDVLAQRCEVLA